VFTQQLVNGVSLGFVYALLALGLALAYSTSRVINFAHGDVFTLGAFVGLGLQRHLGIHFGLAAVGASIAVFLGGAVFSYHVLWRLRTSLERSVSTIALGLGLRDGMLIIFGSDSQSFDAVYPTGVIGIGGMVLPSSLLIVIALTALLLVGVGLAVTMTSIGIQMRAAAQDPELAAMIGISTRKIQALGFGSGCMLAAIAGVLVGPVWQVYYAAGSPVGVKAFTAALLGGFGSLRGATLGGLMVGVLEALLAGYVSSTWKDLGVYACLLMTLLLLPRGLVHTGSNRVG